jgi:hypothetical protein
MANQPQLKFLNIKIPREQSDSVLNIKDDGNCLFRSLFDADGRDQAAHLRKLC